MKNEVKSPTSIRSGILKKNYPLTNIREEEKGDSSDSASSSIVMKKQNQGQIPNQILDHNY